MNRRHDFRFFDHLRVRWAEVDMQKIVFNGHYLMYLDTAVAGYWRAMAMPYHETMALLQGDLYVRKATLEYHASAHYEDRIDVGMRCARIGNSSMVFEGGVFRGDELLVSGELVYVFADPSTQTSQPVPAQLRAALDAFERGEAMVDVRTGTWDQLGREAQALRTAVFVDEQKIPAELEWDAADANAVHAVAYNGFGMALGTGRLLEHAPGVAKVGRMAVRHDLRGAGIGAALLEALAGVARTRGDREVLLHAQRSAEGFYARQGFAVRGQPFDEAGIAHVAMVRAITPLNAPS
ncbi:YbgC/FadM family acyl-CoA thioesterase [Azohydromonas sp.]|uniref:YbgC/FadM family acyl-CoA thioesterase n=1 Tax=Azohydromonas sp. TaxID=1872666 RepID=UPI002D0140CA|nr:YbgC/FadM family acyl-CoA thioesterase [Azohydromonas sp.]HMM85979.1 YbgC/FadM family acyl-CoA thioesterase [Azohydromonas sp.]